MVICNLADLSCKGNVRGRNIVLDVIEDALKRVNFYDLARDYMESRMGSLIRDPNEYGNIFVIGGGKHVSSVAAALEEVLGERIREGVVVEKVGSTHKTKRITVLEGGHPVPNVNSVKGAQEIVRIASSAEDGDLVLVCVTGGWTSLTALPPSEITLEELRQVFDLLLRSGAPIEDMNTVRKHLSQLGGGKLSMLAHPAEIVGLIGIDEVPGLPWGPTVPDTTTFSDAIHVLERYDLWNRVPESIRKYFERADTSEETPKRSDFERIGVKAHNVVFAENGTLCRIAERRAMELVKNAAVLSTSIEGEAKDVGAVLASIAKEIEKNSRPFDVPCILLIGGETTVTMTGEHGEGGRNQELALAAALKIAGSKRIVIASVGTDGTDGPTDIAGAIVDGYTLEEAERRGIDLSDHLKRHDSSCVFRRLADAIYTGNTGTNLMDLMVVYVGESSKQARSAISRHLMARRGEFFTLGPSDGLDEALGEELPVRMATSRIEQADYKGHRREAFVTWSAYPILRDRSVNRQSAHSHLLVHS